MSGRHQVDGRTRRRIRITVAILAAVVVLIYVGFIVERVLV